MHIDRAARERLVRGTGAAAVFLLLCFTAACAARRPDMLTQDQLRSLGCRIVEVAGGPVRTIAPLADVNLDALSTDEAGRSFAAEIHDRRKLSAQVRHVPVLLPRDRFNVTLSLDGKPLVRVNHMDLDIYIETTIDDRVYALHCFPEFPAIE